MLLSPFISGGQGYLVSNGSKVEISFHLFDGKIILPIKVDDQLTLNFVLDTGVNQPILLDRRWAKKLGWRYHRETQFLGVGSARKVNAKVTYPQVKLELPGLMGEDITFLVLQQDPLNLHQYDIHGLIGAHLFMDPLVKIDYKRKVITFSNHFHFSPNQQNYQLVDLTFKNLKPFVQAQINQQNIELLMDLGSAHEVLLFGKSFKNSGVIFEGKGFGGSFKALGTVAQEIRLGNQYWKGVYLLYMPAKKYSQEQALGNRQGSLGGGLFKDHLLVLDYKHQKMYLKPNNSAEMNNLNPAAISAQNHNTPFILD